MATNPVEAGSTYIHKTLASFNRSAYQPSLSISYISTGDAVEIDTNVLTSVTVPTAGRSAVFRFKPASTGFYTFESLDIATCDPYAWLYNSSFELLTEADDADDTNFRLTYHLIKDYTYYFRAGCYDIGTGNYSVKLSKVTSPSYLDTTIINWGDSKIVSCNLDKPVSIYRFTPTESAEYLLYSFNPMVDPMIWIYDSNLNYIDSDDDGGMNLNFRYVDELIAGETYYIAAGTFEESTGTYFMSILMDVIVPTDVYPLMNMDTGKYLDIHGPYEQEKVHQWSFHTGAQSRWTFTRGTDGYYTIRSNFGNQYYVGVSDVSVYTDNVGLHPSVSANTQWKIYAYPTGEFLLEPRYAEGTALYVPNSYDGTELQLVYMNFSDSVKWKIEVKSSTPLEGQRWTNWCWATSARMLTNHYFDVPDDRTQNNAVSAVKGSVVNSGGTHTDAIGAASFYQSNSINVNELNLVGEFGARFSDSTLRQFINDGHIVYIARGSYDWYNNRSGGHATVIVGYTTISVNGSLQYRYIINDPWPADVPNPWSSPEITTGQIIMRSYQWICNGQNALDCDPIDNGIWDRYVVVETDYSDNTLSPVYN